MRSPADQIRVERVLRITGLVALAAWVVNAARPALTHVDVATDASLRSSLAAWTRTAGADSVHVTLDTVPSGAPGYRRPRFLVWRSDSSRRTRGRCLN